MRAAAVAFRARAERLLEFSVAAAIFLLGAFSWFSLSPNRERTARVPKRPRPQTTHVWGDILTSEAPGRLLFPSAQQIKSTQVELSRV